jgi:electron-transferring-flavoprotein dehydrogenase
MERESLHFDVLIIGAGPAGLSAAIRLAQLSYQDEQPLSICVLEKGPEVGANILSGAIIETKALDELIPNWREQDAPIHVPVTEDQFYLLAPKFAIRLPTPLPMHNKGNYVISLENLCKWLGKQAEQLGVAIFPGFAGVEVLYQNGKIVGVLTGDKGLAKDGRPTERYQPGIKLLANHTLFAEGCRGSLVKQLVDQFNLQEGRSPQTYGIGVKEIWEVPTEQHHPGKVIHTIGWPLDTKTYGGSFIYHGEKQQVAVGFVVGLDYKNPYLDPFEELQKFKKHPKFIETFRQGRRLYYGAKAIAEGGIQSWPKLTLPGGMILGDSAGTLNVPKIKGTHTAMKSGMIAAETVYANRHRLDQSLDEFEINLRNTWLGEELFRARNIRPGFKHGLWSGLTYAALDTYLLRGKAPWTFKNHADHTILNEAIRAKKKIYPKPDNKITFDKLSSVYLSNLHYDENQPCHLQLKNPEIAIDINLKLYDSPETRYCPAKVYEILYQNNQPYLQINASNCVHCKTCDIKDPKQNINWVPPEGGDGPNYIDM